MPSRTESKVMRVAPGEEQSTIDFMQKLFWNLLSTQEIKTSDNYLKKKDDAIYQVHTTDHYVKMAFSRYLDTPHLDKIKAYEKEYFDMPEPVYPKVFPLGIWIWLIGGIVLGALLVPVTRSLAGMFVGVGIVGAIWIVYYALHYSIEKDKADRQAKDLNISRKEIMERMEHLEKLPA